MTGPICATENCQRPASLRLFWDGRELMLMCKGCASSAMVYAAASEVPVSARPIVTDERAVQ